MFAGAAREAVFSKREVVRRIRRDIIPVALKAGLVNNPPLNAEGRLYREIARSKPAPQGICAVNSAGKVLAWALSFDNDDSVPAFLDHVQKLYEKHPNADAMVTAERYMRFPSNRMRDVEDSGASLVIPEVGSAGTIPTTPKVAVGTMVARLVGRVVDEDGKPVQKTRSQETYLEDLFHIGPAEQASLAQRLRESDSVRLLRKLAHALATHACLGQLDVMPRRGGDVKHASFRVERGKGTFVIRGTTEIDLASSNRFGDRASFAHAVKLEWEGFLSMAGDRITELCLFAKGTEKLRWGNPRFARRFREEQAVSHLMAGRPIDWEGRVCYGLIAEPAPEEQTSPNARIDSRPRGAGRPRMEQTPAGMRGVQQRLQRLHKRIEELVRRGQTAKAQRLLDEALKLFDR